VILINKNYNIQGFLLEFSSWPQSVWMSVPLLYRIVVGMPWFSSTFLKSRITWYLGALPFKRGVGFNWYKLW